MLVLCVEASSASGTVPTRTHTLSWPSLGGSFIASILFLVFAHINIYFAISTLHWPSKFAVDFRVCVATLVAFAQLIVIPSFAVCSEEILRKSEEFQMCTDLYIYFEQLVLSFFPLYLT